MAHVVEFMAHGTPHVLTTFDATQVPRKVMVGTRIKFVICSVKSTLFAAQASGTILWGMSLKVWLPSPREAPKQTTKLPSYPTSSLTCKFVPKIVGSLRPEDVHAMHWWAYIPLWAVHPNFKPFSTNQTNHCSQLGFETYCCMLGHMRTCNAALYSYPPSNAHNVLYKTASNALKNTLQKHTVTTQWCNRNISHFF